MKKIFLLMICFTCIQTLTFAQGFSTFTVEGALERPVIRNVNNGPSEIECIVNENVDIKNVDFKYKLLSGCSLESPLSKDFTNPQKVVVTKNNSNPKEWIVYVKRLVPAKLPLNLNFSAANTSDFRPDAVGWASIGVDARKNTVVRFGNQNVSFWTAYASPARYVSYELKPVSKDEVDFDGDFTVETSADGNKWKELHAFNSKNGFDASGQYRHELPKDARFVRWTYLERNKLNVNLNDISITE